MIATGWFCEKARPAIFRSQRVLLPDPTRNAGHIIFHSEIFHELYALNKVQLRHVIDLVLLRMRHGKAIDWDELDHRFSAAGAGEVLATYLHLIGELLHGQSAGGLRHHLQRGQTPGQGLRTGTGPRHSLDRPSRESEALYITHISVRY